MNNKTIYPHQISMEQRAAHKRSQSLAAAGAALALEGEYELSEQVLSVAARLEAISESEAIARIEEGQK